MLLPFFWSIWIISVDLVIGSKSLFLVGDSIDRYIAEDWCVSSSNTNQDWGDPSLKYGGHYGILHSPSFCVNSVNESLAAIHVYGSNSGTQHCRFSPENLNIILMNLFTPIKFSTNLCSKYSMCTFNVQARRVWITI